MSVPSVTLSGSALTGITPNLKTATLPTRVCLGRIPPLRVVDLGGFRLRVYPDGSHKVTALLGAHFDSKQLTSPPPDTVDYYTKAMASISRMYGNDRLGDCVVAGKGHSFGVWTANESGSAALATDAEVVSQYHQWCGPGDNGCVITGVLDNIRRTGMVLNGVRHFIDDYVSVDHTKRTLVEAAIQHLGTVSIGIMLPDDWTRNSVWDVTNSRIVGGHDVTCVGYNSQGVQISSWGRVYTITWAAFLSTRWLDEADVPLAPDWYTKGGLSPLGINATTLRDALDKLKVGITPDITPSPLPPTPPSPPSPPSPPPVVGGWTEGSFYQGQLKWRGKDTAAVITAVPFAGSAEALADTDVASDGQYVVCGPPPGFPPTVVVLDRATGAKVCSFNAFHASWMGGVYVAVASGFVRCGPRKGGAPLVVDFTAATGAMIGSRYEGDPKDRNGIRPFLSGSTHGMQAGTTPPDPTLDPSTE